MVGWCGSECHGVIFNNSRCQPHAPVPHVCEGQSRVYQSLCVDASSASHLVLGCSAHSGVLCKRRWERGMALGMVSLHNNHLTHAWWCTTLCAISHHASFLFCELRMEQCCSQEWVLCLWCQCFHVQSNCLGKHLPQCFHESALKVHIIHCDSLATVAPLCWLCMKCNLVCNVAHPRLGV